MHSTMCYLRSCRQNLLPVFLAILSLSTETQAAVVIDEVLAEPLRAILATPTETVRARLMKTNSSNFITPVRISFPSPGGA